jgi:hypothetical protein
MSMASNDKRTFKPQPELHRDLEIVKMPRSDPDLTPILKKMHSVKNP